MKDAARMFAAWALACVWTEAGMAGPLSVQIGIDTPEAIACAHEKMVTEGLGVLFPSEEQAHVPGGIVTFGGGEDTWPPLFRLGLVPEKTNGLTVYPFTVELDDETGEALFRNANRALFYSVAPAYAAATGWFRMRLGVPAFGPIPAYRELSHLVSEWVLVHEDGVESLQVQGRKVQSQKSKVQCHRVQSREVEGLAFAEFEITDSEPPGFGFTVSWSEDAVSTNDVLDLYGASALTTNEWYRLASIAATNESPFVLTLSETNFPWYVPPVECPRPGCSCPACIPVVATNYAGSAFDPSATNLTMTIVTNTTCDCLSGAPAGFFRLFRRADSDADGLLDAEEALLYGTDPLLADSDGDGLDDAEEIDLGINPRKSDTDGDGISDLSELGWMRKSSFAEWVDVSGGTNLLAGYNGFADDEIWTLPLLSPIVADCEQHDRVAIDLNGLIFLLRDGESVSRSYPTNQSLRAWSQNPAHIAIAPYWYDLLADSSSAIYVLDNPTNAPFVVEYRDLLVKSGINAPLRTGFTPDPPTQFADTRVTVQVRIPRDTPDHIRIHYRFVPNSGDGIAATVGIQNNRRGDFTLPREWYVLPRPGEPPLIIDDETIFDYWLGLGTDPTSSDTDGDGLDDRTERDETASDPVLADLDEDGLDDPTENRLGTDPRRADTDGDGVEDGDEIQNETDPLDPNDRIPVQWIFVVGHGSTNSVKKISQVFTVPRGTASLVSIFAHSMEFPDYTGNPSQYNDKIGFRILTNQVLVAWAAQHVNDLHGAWSQAGTDGVLSYAPTVILTNFLACAGPVEDLDVTVEIGAVNVADEYLPSTVIAGVFPLKVVQTNMPLSAASTDMGTRAPRRLLRDGIAYITGEPSAPALRASFAGLPGFVHVGWNLDLKTERTQRRMLDDRKIPESGYAILDGNAVYDIEQTLHEIVGGCMTVGIFPTNGASGTFSFRIRGKNPRDAEVESFLQTDVDEDFQPFIQELLRQETSSGDFTYNQFNVSMEYLGLPNLSSDQNGWGMGQISKTIDESTCIVWNWKENVREANLALREKQRTSRRFLDKFREAYGETEYWEEPPSAYTMEGMTLSAEAWGTCTLYNGTKGIPWCTIPGVGSSQTPWLFDPSTGTWVLRPNANDYARKVAQRHDQTFRDE